MRGIGIGPILRPGFVTMVVLMSGCGDAVVHVSGRVEDSSGAPVENAVVKLAPREGTSVKADAHQVVTGSTGEYAVELIFSPHAKDPRFTLDIQKQGFRPHSEEIVDGVQRRDIVLRREGSQKPGQNDFPDQKTGQNGPE